MPSLLSISFGVKGLKKTPSVVTARNFCDTVLYDTPHVCLGGIRRARRCPFTHEILDVKARNKRTERTSTGFHGKTKASGCSFRPVVALLLLTEFGTNTFVKIPSNTRGASVDSFCPDTSFRACRRSTSGKQCWYVPPTLGYVPWCCSHSPSPHLHRHCKGWRYIIWCLQNTWLPGFHSW